MDNDQVKSHFFSHMKPVIQCREMSKQDIESLKLVKNTAGTGNRKASRVSGILSTALHTCFPVLFGRHTKALAVWLVFL